MNKSDKKNSSSDSSFNLKKEIISWIQVIVTAALIAFILNGFIIANSVVPTGSMENTIMTGDRVVGLRLSYKFSEPQRGDIAIFRFPDDETTYYVKRIIGLPGESVDIKNGHVYINDVLLDEPYLKETMAIEPALHFEVPSDSYFMMGDNRNSSHDARYWNNHYVSKKKIIAKVLFRYYPNFTMIK